MDPNANLAEQLKLSERIVNESYNSLINFKIDAERLAELVIALNNWIKMGGTLPTSWEF